LQILIPKNGPYSPIFRADIIGKLMPDAPSGNSLNTPTLKDNWESCKKGVAGIFTLGYNMQQEIRYQRKLRKLCNELYLGMLQKSVIGAHVTYTKATYTNKKIVWKTSWDKITW
jgi:hypothetical protein